MDQYHRGRSKGCAGTAVRLNYFALLIFASGAYTPFVNSVELALKHASVYCSTPFEFDLDLRAQLWLFQNFSAVNGERRVETTILVLVEEACRRCSHCIFFLKRKLYALRVPFCCWKAFLVDSSHSTPITKRMGRQAFFSTPFPLFSRRK